MRTLLSPADMTKQRPRQFSWYWLLGLVFMDEAERLARLDLSEEQVAARFARAFATLTPQEQALLDGFIFTEHNVETASAAQFTVLAKALRLALAGAA